MTIFGFVVSHQIVGFFGHLHLQVNEITVLFRCFYKHYGSSPSPTYNVPCQLLSNEQQWQLSVYMYIFVHKKIFRCQPKPVEFFYFL